MRDDGFVTATVELLRCSVEEGDEASAVAAAIAISATCTANDGNKQEASAASKLLLLALAKFVESVNFQTEGISALRCLLTDDDPRTSDSAAAAVDNREVLMLTSFKELKEAVERGCNLADSSKVKLQEQSLLLLREIARGEEAIKVLAFEDKLLQRTMRIAVEEAEKADPRVVRAGLAVLRAFAFVEEVRDELGLLTEGAVKCVEAVKKHISTPTVCEQGFGLFTNLTMRKSNIAAKLEDFDIFALAQLVLKKHPERLAPVRVVVLPPV